MIHNKYFEIMKMFLKGYDREIYGRELVKKVSISQKNIALTLEELEGEGILSSKINGNLKNYFLNKSNNLIGKYLVLVEMEKTIEFFKNHKKVFQIFERNDFSGIMCIFGSYAKEIEKNNSDLDLFVVGNVDEKKLNQEGETFGVELSIKSGTKKDFREMLKKRNPLVNEILENHVLISGHEEFVREVIKTRW